VDIATCSSFLGTECSIFFTTSLSVMSSLSTQSLFTKAMMQRLKSSTPSSNLNLISVNS
jgi:hypothetical protein